MCYIGFSTCTRYSWVISKYFHSFFFCAVGVAWWIECDSVCRHSTFGPQSTQALLWLWLHELLMFDYRRQHYFLNPPPHVRAHSSNNDLCGEKDAEGLKWFVVRIKLKTANVHLIVYFVWHHSILISMIKRNSIKCDFTLSELVFLGFHVISWPLVSEVYEKFNVCFFAKKLIRFLSLDPWSSLVL